MANEESEYTTISLRLPKLLLDEFDQKSKEKGFERRTSAFINLIEKDIGAK